jgi:hypothetical protein
MHVLKLLRQDFFVATHRDKQKLYFANRVHLFEILAHSSVLVAVQIGKVVYRRDICGLRGGGRNFTPPPSQYLHEPPSGNMQGNSYDPSKK